MGLQLEDGKGRGYAVAVNSEHRLEVESYNVPFSHGISEDGKHFIIPFNTVALPTLTVTNTGGYFLTVKNESDDNMTITHICVSSDTSGMILQAVKGVTWGTLGNETEVTPVNGNLTSGQTADATAYQWDEVGDGITGITGGSLIYGLQLEAGGSSHLAEDGGLILGKNDTIAFYAKKAGELNGHMCVSLHEKHAH
jgi:hypothetical protein